MPVVNSQIRIQGKYIITSSVAGVFTYVNRANHGENNLDHFFQMRVHMEVISSDLSTYCQRVISLQHNGN